jgi:hypothetical protein
MTKGKETWKNMGWFPNHLTRGLHMSTNISLDEIIMCGHLGVQENRNIKSSCREGHHQELI